MKIDLKVNLPSPKTTSKHLVIGVYFFGGNAMILQIKDNIDQLKIFQVLNDYSQKQMGELLNISASTYCRLINRIYIATPKVQQRIHNLINQQ